jgi:CheY-like chemotaxis protein
MLLAEKYDVFGYDSPTKALKAIGAVRPDLLVLDIGMATPNGVDCLKVIRSMPGYLDIPAVAFTGFGGEVERQAFLAAGFDAVVVKPVFDPQELIAVIERVLTSRAAAQQRAAGYPRRSASPVVSHLDVQKPSTASFGRESRETDGSASARHRDENAG